MEASELRYKPLTEEQLDELLEAFNELQATDYQAAIVGKSGNMAVEIRDRVIDPDSLEFILDVAKRRELKPYVFQTESGAPLVLIPPREVFAPATPENTPTASARMADEEQPIGLTDAQSRIDDAPAEVLDDQEADQPGFTVDVFGDSVLISLPGVDDDTEGPSVSMPYSGIREQPIALEVAEAIGARAAAAVADGVEPFTALTEAANHGQDAFRRAVGQLAPVGMEGAVEGAVPIDEIPDA